MSHSCGTIVFIKIERQVNHSHCWDMAREWTCFWRRRRWNGSKFGSIYYVLVVDMKMRLMHEYIRVNARSMKIKYGLRTERWEIQSRPEVFWQDFKEMIVFSKTKLVSGRVHTRFWRERISLWNLFQSYILNQYKPLNRSDNLSFSILQFFLKRNWIFPKIQCSIN